MRISIETPEGKGTVIFAQKTNPMETIRIQITPEFLQAITELCLHMGANGHRPILTLRPLLGDESTIVLG